MIRTDFTQDLRLDLDLPVLYNVHTWCFDGENTGCSILLALSASSFGERPCQILPTSDGDALGSLFQPENDDPLNVHTGNIMDEGVLRIIGFDLNTISNETPFETRGEILATDDKSRVLGGISADREFPPNEFTFLKGISFAIIKVKLAPGRSA